MAEIDVHHGLVFATEVADSTPPGVVDDLIGHHQRARQQVITNTPHRRAGDQGLHAGLAQRPDVGPVVDVMRRDGVAVAVPRQEHHRNPGQPPERQRAGGLAPGRARHLAVHVFQTGQIQQTTATDDADHRPVHRQAGRRQCRCHAVVDAVDHFTRPSSAAFASRKARNSAPTSGCCRPSSTVASR